MPPSLSLSFSELTPKKKDFGMLSMTPKQRGRKTMSVLTVLGSWVKLNTTWTSFRASWCAEKESNLKKS